MALSPTSATGMPDQRANILGQSDPVLAEAFLREFWRIHVLPSPKGRALPKATFEMGQLAEVVLEQLEMRDRAWETVVNRVLLRSTVMVHWEQERRLALYGMVEELSHFICTANEVSLGNGQQGWRQPVLITPANGNGLVVPIAIVPKDDCIEIRSLITPVTPHRLKELRSRR